MENKCKHHNNMHAEKCGCIHSAYYKMFNSKPGYIALILFSLVWLLLRTGSKPSRIVYPCQKAALSTIGGAFSILIVIIHRKIFTWGALIGLKRPVQYLTLLITLSIFACFLTFVTHNYQVKKSWVEYNALRKTLAAGKLVSPNKNSLRPLYQTIPTALALPSPHRVVTIHDKEATTWAGSGNPAVYMKQKIINIMVNRGVMDLTGETNAQSAWAKLLPYQQGEAVAIKLNFNNSGGSWTADPYMNPYAEVVNAVIDGLISIGVPPEKIWLTDPSRAISNAFRSRITNKQVLFYTHITSGSPGESQRVYYTDYVSDASVYSTVSVCPERINPASVFVNAAHIINVPQLKGHGGASVTLGLKNHFGSVSLTGDALGSDPTHKYFYIGGSNYGGAAVNLLADINNNPIFRDKTRLIIGDGLMGHPTVNYSNPVVWSSFNNGPPEILFFGCDPVAVDSVMFDYLQRECRVKGQAARNDDILVNASNLGLGVFEHWVGDSDRRYSTIDYKAIDFDSVTEGDFNNNGEITAYDAALTAQGAVGLIQLGPLEFRAAEVSGEGNITAYDAALIAQKAVGLITNFPVES
jgi:uncharacterized protein (DUF362 family)